MCAPWDPGDDLVALKSISLRPEEACKIVLDDKGKQYNVKAFCELSLLTLNMMNQGIPWDLVVSTISAWGQPDF